MEETSSNLIARLALGVSIYAGVIATIVGAWTVYGIRRDRSSIKIGVQYGYIRTPGRGPYVLYSNEFKREEISETTRLVITARNTGRRPVLLSQGGLRSRGDIKHAFTGDGWDKQYPIRLDEGESGSTWISLTVIREGLRRDGEMPPFWAYFQAESGKTYKSKVPRMMARVLLDESET